MPYVDAKPVHLSTTYISTQITGNFFFNLTLKTLLGNSDF
jgi:hypothetical protein